MMFHLRIFLLLLFFFSPLFQKGALLAGEKSNGSLTLAESIKLALENNKRVVQTKELINGSEAKVEEARSIFFPQLKLESNYYRLSWLPLINFAFPGLPMEKIKFGVYNNYGAQLSLYQSLFTWGRNTKGIELSEVELTMAKANAALTEREVAYAVVQLFYQILMVQEAVKVIDENLKLLEEHFSLVRKKYDAGELSNYDVLSTEVHISTTSGQKLDAETNLKKLELQFNKILGRTANAVVQLEHPPTYVLTSIDDKLYLREAVEKRIELKQAQNKERLAQLQKEIASTTNKPNVDFFFNWNIQNGYLPNLNLIRGVGSAGIIFSLPLFNGFRTNAQVNQAEVNVRALQMEYEDVKQSIETEIHQSILELKTAEKKIEIEKIKIRQAEDALKIAVEQFNSGHLSTLDLLDSQQSLKNAKLNYLLSLLNFNVSRFTLEKSAGREF